MAGVRSEGATERSPSKYSPSCSVVVSWVLAIEDSEISGEVGWSGRQHGLMSRRHLNKYI